MTDEHKALGAVCTVGAFLIWGGIVIYYKAVAHVDSPEVLAHRILWSLLFLFPFLISRKIRQQTRAAFSLHTLSRLVMSTLLVSLNWLVVIWGAKHNQVLGVSLGFFINPLVSVACGVLFLGERLNRRQTLAVALALAGVLNLAISHGRLPWVSLSLAFSFGLYGLVRKKTQVAPIPGLIFETSLMALPALAFLWFLSRQGTLAFGNLDRATDVLLIAGGIISLAPMILFLMGVQRLRLSTVGLIQYIAPSISFLLAIFAYHEPFTGAQRISFPMVWLALIIYSVDWTRFARKLGS
jgi:chloramphenicol-sensitive protein RarD